MYGHHFRGKGQPRATTVDGRVGLRHENLLVELDAEPQSLQARDGPFRTALRGVQARRPARGAAEEWLQVLWVHRNRQQHREGEHQLCGHANGGHQEQGRGGEQVHRGVRPRGQTGPRGVWQGQDVCPQEEWPGVRHEDHRQSETAAHAQAWQRQDRVRQGPEGDRDNEGAAPPQRGQDVRGDRRPQLWQDVPDHGALRRG
mmetsp:Transcript_28074/g.50581  ORF Transcript_28074/g.50581 Transcript_28074/m.50581 type:complete len:201 (+) Transcript_28074:256-858(+)